MSDAPLSIRRFETLQIVTATIGLINGFAVIHDDIFRSVMSAVIMLALTFLVSRGRKNWPRWVFLGAAALGFPWVLWSVPAIIVAYGYFPAAVAVGVSLMNVLALVLLFTPESAKWLRTQPLPA